MKKIRTKSETGSALLDPDVKRRLQTAAVAAGLDSIEALTNLVIDSGAVAIPPTDGVTEVYTLEDLGVQMRAKMPQTGRPQWFQGLVKTQQTALVALLRERGYSTAVIARDFEISELDVNKTFAKYADDLGAQVVNVRLNTLVGNMQIVAERASEGAMQKKDWNTVWRIQKEVIGILQSLGIVKQAIRKVEVAHHFDDQKSAEVEALLDLERKQRARQEEIKRADVEVLDEVPQLALPSGPGSMEEHYDDDE